MKYLRRVWPPPEPPQYTYLRESRTNKVFDKIYRHDKFVLSLSLYLYTHIGKDAYILDESIILYKITFDRSSYSSRRRRYACVDCKLTAAVCWSSSHRIWASLLYYKPPSTWKGAKEVSLPRRHRTPRHRLPTPQSWPTEPLPPPPPPPPSPTA